MAIWLSEPPGTGRMRRRFSSEGKCLLTLLQPCKASHVTLRSKRVIWRMPSSGKWCRNKRRFGRNYRFHFEGWNNQRNGNNVSSKGQFLQRSHYVTSQKMSFFILTAVKSSVAQSELSSKLQLVSQGCWRQCVRAEGQTVEGTLLPNTSIQHLQCHLFGRLNCQYSTCNSHRIFLRTVSEIFLESNLHPYTFVNMTSLQKSIQV
jgi:hypothetical protein